MDKTPFQSALNLISYDMNNIPKDAVKGLGWLTAFILGQVGTCVYGFGASQTITPSLTINLAEGQIYAMAPVDASPIGSFAADSYQIMQQGWIGSQQITLNASGLSSGQSKWWLIQVEFQQLPAVRSGDPTAGQRGFYNPTDPSNPLNGVNGLGGTVNTVILGKARVTAKAGAANTTGSHVPPTADSGCVPLYLVSVTNGQSTITTGQIQLAGPTAYAGYPNAPFIAGLLNSHHRGTPGHAPQILLNGANKEVTGIMEFANLPATNTVAPGIKLPTIRSGTGSPVGVLPGEVGDLFLATDTGDLWRCTAAGTNITATWSPGTPQGVTIIDTFPATITASAGTFALKLSGADGTVNLPSTASNRKLRFIRYDSTPFDAILTPSTGAEKIYRDGANNNTMKLKQGESCDLESLPAPDSKWLFS